MINLQSIVFDFFPGTLHMVVMRVCNIVAELPDIITFPGSVQEYDRKAVGFR